MTQKKNNPFLEEQQFLLPLKENVRRYAPSLTFPPLSREVLSLPLPLNPDYESLGLSRIATRSPPGFQDPEQVHSPT